MPKCGDCGKSFGLFELREGRCSSCRELRVENRQNEREAAERARRDAGRLEGVSLKVLDEAAAKVVLTTAISMPGDPPHEIVAVVAAEVTTGMNLIKDIAVSVRDLVGGRSGTLEASLKAAREAALAELRREAFRVGANAVIAVSIRYGDVGVGPGNGVLYVAAAGTAIRTKS